jgi:outer membrane protein insertion porin family
MKYSVGCKIIMKKVSKNILLSICCSTLLICSSSLQAASNSAFIVKKINVTGLQRISVGTVLNYLPIQVGEEVDTTSTGDIIHTLYETGFFKSVSLERQGNTLIVNVVERATIGMITVAGNKEIPADKMKELLKQMGLVKGQVFQRSALERLEKELKQAYNVQGKYSAHLNTTIAKLTDNRVAITVTISEGRVSRIREIKFIGNHDFSTNELMPELSLSTSSIFTYFTKKDQYSKTAMDTSLEAIRSFYLDRGYLKFAIVSSQVMLSPDKKDVFITINIEEGPQYHFSGTTVVGNHVLPLEKINTLIDVHSGDVFSRRKVTQSISAIGLALGDEGYGFPAINAEPRIDEINKTVFITFVVEPGRHVYVRRINFSGNPKTADYVLRSAIRQDEGGLLSLHNIKESERQIRLLGYMKNVNVNTTPVLGTNNQVDLDIQVEEAPSTEATASIGYGTNGPQVNAAFNQHNFLGTGRAVGFSFVASYWGQQYAFNYYNPFYTNTGIGRGLNIYYETVDPNKLSDISTYSADRIGGDISYNVLLNESSSVQFGYGFQNLFIHSVGMVQQNQNFINLYGRSFNEIRLTSGWNRNSYDQIPFPNHGINQQVTLLAALPASSQSLTYYKTAYTVRTYQPVTKGFIVSLLGNVAYGNSFNKKGLPFFENYYAGGIAQPGQIRGYQTYTLGPHDWYGNAMGGNLLINASAGVILPYPFSRDNVRTTVFSDAGNVYARGIPLPLRGTSSGPIRYSAGMSLEWRSPFGPLAFSVAKPLNKQPSDDTQLFQFTMASGF